MNARNRLFKGNRRARIGKRLGNLGFDQGVKFWAFGDEVRFVR